MKTIRPLNVLSNKEKALEYLATGEYRPVNRKEATPAGIALVALFHHLVFAGTQVKVYPYAMNAMIHQLAAIIEGKSISEYDISWDCLLVQGVAWKEDVRATGRCNLALLNFFCHLSDAIRVTNRTSISPKWALYLMQHFDGNEGLFEYGELDDKLALFENTAGRQVLGQSACFSYPDFDPSELDVDTFKTIFAQFGKM